MGRWYPKKIIATEAAEANALLLSSATTPLIDFLEQSFHGHDRDKLRIAEFGTWQGGTSVQLAKFLRGKGELHLFDFQETVDEVKKMLQAAGHHNVHAWGSTYKHLDSYNWSLRRLLSDRPDLRFNYIYLDGAHTWAVDALTFLLCDLMLDDGGYIEFDDYDWRLRGSSLDPLKVQVISEQYTEEQIDDHQVKAIIDLLVKRNPSHTPVKENRLYQKVASCHPPRAP